MRIRRVVDAAPTTTTTYDPEDRVLSRTVTAGDLSETETYAYDALGRTVSAIDSSGIETRYLYAIDSTLGLETRSTIRAVGTAQAVTNTTISYADGVFEGQVCIASSMYCVKGESEKTLLGRGL